MIPCLLFEDEHWLAVNKPAGIATHRAAELAPWGIFEFLRNHRPDLHGLGIHQRLDRRTSGVLIFSKSSRARQSLSRQFEGHRAMKEYVFLTHGSASARDFQASDPIEGKPAKTRFRFQRSLSNRLHLWKAFPETGRTHQVRLHAARYGLLIVGDHNENEPLLLHAARLELEHPATGQRAVFEAPMPIYFETADTGHRSLQAAIALRCALIDEKETNACRWIHRHADGYPMITVDRFDEWLYVEDFGTPDADKGWDDLLEISKPFSAIRGIVHSPVSPDHPRREKRLVAGTAPPSEIVVRENRVRYRTDLLCPGSPGLFLDQRENRRHLQSLAHGRRILNLFAYTCGFSAAAAVAGARETVNVDLSRRAVDRGRENFRVNNLDASLHRFWAGDVFEHLAKTRRRGEKFDLVFVDPPSSSRSKSSGHFSAKRDYSKLVFAASARVEKEGWLFCSTNLASLKDEVFLAAVESGLKKSGREIAERLWMPQPFDFPAAAHHPPYLKSIWLRLVE